MASEWLKQLFAFRRSRTPEPIAPGLHHAVREAEGAVARFHLRVERDGSGMLIGNATAAARLSPSGVVIAKGLLDGEDEAEILKSLGARFRGASEEIMCADIAQVKALLDSILSPGDLYPVFNLENAALSPYEAELIAPLQAAVPLADPGALLPVLDRLWAVGIPHVTILAPENPDVAALVRAVERAEDLGMIAGVRARASDLVPETLLPDLAVAGVDHVTVPYAAVDPAVHDALYGAGDHAAAVETLAWLEQHEVCAVTEVPLLTHTVDRLDETVPALMSMGTDTLSFVAFAVEDAVPGSQRDGAIPAAAMPQVATIVEEAAHEVQALFIWQPPVQRDPARSLVDQVRQGPRCPGDIAVRVEPDGTVIPPRGPYRSAGNVLHDRWEDIWNHEAFRIYRERVEAPTRCDVCPGLTICAADCPRESAGWSQAASGGENA